MKVVAEPESLAEDQFRYLVVRDLAGTGRCAFKIGEALVRMGNSQQNNPMHTLASGEEGAEFGSYQPGGSGSKTEGGWLILEGTRGKGPYFGVARREGPLYNQFSEVVRIGNLMGVLPEYTNITYGAFVGDVSRYLAYDVGSGLRIKTRGGSTAIDDDGIATDEFSLMTALNEPEYVEGKAKFFFAQDTPEATPRVGIKMQSGGMQVLVTRIGDLSWDQVDANDDGVIDTCFEAMHTYWEHIENKPSTFTPSAHQHQSSDIIGFTEVDMTQAYERAWIGL